jgi:hypothetical protein
VGRSLRVLGTVLRADGIEATRGGVRAARGGTARLEHAKALAALGTTLRLGRKSAEAREPLRRALELADVCGAQRLVADVRAETYSTGARPRTALRGILSLTHSEHRVAELAADGQTNATSRRLST